MECTLLSLEYFSQHHPVFFVLGSLLVVNKNMVLRQYNNDSGSRQGTLFQAQNTRPSIQSARSAFHAPMQRRVPSAIIPDTAKLSVARSYPEPRKINNPELSNNSSDNVSFPDYRLLELILHARRLLYFQPSG